MLTLKAALQKRVDLMASASAIFNAAEAEKRSLTADEAKKDDEIAAELTALDGEIARLQRHAERKRTEAGAIDDHANEGKFESFGEMLRAVAIAGRESSPIIDPRLMTIGAGPSGASGQLASDGGFLVDTEFVADLLQNAWDQGDITSRVRKIPIGPGKSGIKMNGVDERSRANGSRSGGIQAYWTGEAQQITATQPKFKKLQLELEKLTAACYATNEILDDAVALQGWIDLAFPAEMSFKLEDAIVNGNGAGMPLGWLNSGAVITVAAEGAQAAATLNPQNIVKMWARMPAKNRKNAVWYINQDVEPQLMLMTLLVKNVAGTENVGGVPLPEVIYQPPGSVSNPSPFGLLMGRPVIPIEFAATLGTSGDIQFVDPTQYMMIDKGGVKKDMSIHVRFLFDESVFRFVYRCNGMPLWETAITPYKGNNTISPFVALAAR